MKICFFNNKIILNIYLIGEYMFRQKIISLLLLIIFTIIFNVNYIKANELPLLGKIIYLDPGHGGIDPGSIYKDIYEKDINLEICLKLQKNLEKLGAIVYMTRYDDYDLSDSNALYRKKSDLNNRVRLINDSGADLYVSIHLNSINSSTWYGAQVFYDDVNDQNKYIATIMQEQLRKDFNTDRNIDEISTMLLNRKVNVPGVLIEAGFLSNANERYLLQQDDYQTKISNSIINGIIQYFNQ